MVWSRGNALGIFAPATERGMFMTEYIERKIALSIREPSKSDRHYQTYNLDDAYGQGWDDALCCIESIPVADVAPVRHGHWIYHPDDLFPNDSTQECSYCHAEESLTLYNENYCPNCGARMDEEASE